jgi:hypothetical protein
MNAAATSHLPLEFRHCAFEHVDQGAGAELVGHGNYILHALRPAKGFNEAPTLRARAANQAPLGKNHGPGEDAECNQDGQHDLGDYSGLKYKIEDCATGKKCKDGRKVHGIWEVLR